MPASPRITRLARLAPLGAVLLVGCASAPAASTIETTGKRREMVAVGEQVVVLEPTVARAIREELALPADRAWALLPLAYEALGLPLTTLDSERRLIGAGGVRAQGRLGGAWLSRYVDCGTAATGLANADSYAVTLDVVTQVDGRADGANAGLSTAIRASGRPTSTSTSNPVNCVSRGTLERRLAEVVRERAAATP
ncbi:hypothetical protein [Roseisolibacter agri]|uniref:ABC-type transport auxiliary lipoprotein component domain-containing protein n=1 Tax=Roseisolibacter agri TaxID=2014610 RepID=A0AA37VEV4_9BACT|nr:hypothetical protein [Roseisolibacter agri]GLC25844.1 hypothetical protein rosag_23570 [Roseisolibacter agri]